MPVILVQSEETYTVEETIFRFKRLRYRQQEELQYLYTIRGALDEVAYTQLCIATALTGWEELYSEAGLLPWPSLSDRGEAVFGIVSEARKEQLSTIYTVVAELPRDVALALGARVHAVGPEALKKSAVTMSNGANTLPTSVLGSNSPAQTAEPTILTTTSALPVTEGA